MASIFALLANIWELLFGWLPAPIQALIIIFIGLLLIFLLVKFIAFIWDAIPFL